MIFLKNKISCKIKSSSTLAKVNNTPKQTHTVRKELSDDHGGNLSTWTARFLPIKKENITVVALQWFLSAVVKRTIRGVVSWTSGVKWDDTYKCTFYLGFLMYTDTIAWSPSTLGLVSAPHTHPTHKCADVSHSSQETCTESGLNQFSSECGPALVVVTLW